MIQEIRPQSNNLFDYIQELISYRYLGILLTGRLLITRYKQTILGPLWLILQPIALTGAVTVLFQEILGQETGRIPGLLFYYSGIVLWLFFHKLTTKTANVFVENASLFRKVYFPRVWMALAHLFDGVITILIQLTLLVFINFMLSDFSWNWQYWFALPLPLLWTALWGLNLGFLFAGLSVRYRDFTQVFSFLLSILLFLTPVYFPANSLDGVWLHLLSLNPLGNIFQLWRGFLFGELFLEGVTTAWNVGVLLVSLIFSFSFFIRMERKAMDIL